MTRPPGTIGVPCGELARYTAFTMSLASTVQPDGTNLVVVTSASIVDNLNTIVRSMRDEDEWLWLVGDDHCWDQDALVRLLATMDRTGAEIVVPLVCRRNPPWDLVIATEQTGVDEAGYPMYRMLRYDELPDTGTVEVVASGNAGMLISRGVLGRLGDPWFGSTTGTVLNEDFWFCHRARTEAGAVIVADVEVTMGHIGTYRVWPFRRDDTWGTYTDFAAVGAGQMELFLAGGPRERARAV